MGSIRFNKESTYSRFQKLPVFEVSVNLPHMKRKKIEARYVTKKYERHDRTSDLKACGHILFEMLSSNFLPVCRKCIDLRDFCVK